MALKLKLPSTASRVRTSTVARASLWLPLGPAEGSLALLSLAYVAAAGPVPMHCQRQRASGSEPVAGRQWQRASGSEPAAASQRQRASGSEPVAAAARLASRVSRRSVHAVSFVPCLVCSKTGEESLPGFPRGIGVIMPRLGPSCRWATLKGFRGFAVAGRPFGGLRERRVYSSV